MYQVQLKRQGFTGSAQAGYANWIISIDTPFKGNACFKGEVLGIHTNCKLFECSGGFENCKQAIAQFLKIQFEPEEEAYMPPATNGDIFWTNIAYKPKNNSIVWLFSEDPLLSWQQDLFIDNTPLVDRTRIKIGNRSRGDQKNFPYEITRNRYENQSSFNFLQIILSNQKCYSGLSIVF